jgi:hypothetical protein
VGKSQELERAHRGEMAPIYEKIIDTVKTVDEFAAKTFDEQMVFFAETSTALLLHGPSPVVNAWGVWYRSLGGMPFSVPLRAYEEL